MPVRVGIMGFGRIGRNFFRIAHARQDIEVVAVADIVAPRSLAYLLKYDTVHGRFREPVEVEGEWMRVGAKKIRMLNRREPGDVPWGELGVEVVIESSTRYRNRTPLEKHLAAGAKRVILTVPPRDPVDMVVVMGVNDRALGPHHRVVSIGSPTANCLAPVVKTLHEAFGVERGFMTSVHAYTGEQHLADVPDTDLRRSRSAAENIVPTDTWAPLAVQKLVPELDGRLSGMALSVPVPNGSTLDLTTWMKRPVQATEVNEALRAAAAGPLEGIVEYCQEPIVSSDVIGNTHSAVFDSLSTHVVGGDLLKTLSWYDNGWGHAMRVLELCLRMAELP